MSNAKNNHSQLVPFKKGHDARRPKKPAGRPKGSKNWSTLVKEMMYDEDKLRMALENDPTVKKENIDAIIENMPGNVAAGAIAYTMVRKAMAGDVQAAKFLQTVGHGDVYTPDDEEAETLTPQEIDTIDRTIGQQLDKAFNEPSA